MISKMSKLSLSRGARRFAATVAIVALVLSAGAVQVFAAPAVPIVKSASGAVYGDNGLSFIDSDASVYIAPAPNTAYYYSFEKHSVDVWYDGEPGNPSGSYFDGSLAPGELATVVEALVNSATGAPVSAEGDWKITVPKPGFGGATVLYAIAYSGGEASGVFRHTFLSTDSPLLVTDGGETEYANNGMTKIASGQTALVSQLSSDTQYYYAFGAESEVSVYYSGADGNPSGSYLDGPTAPGAHVATLNGSPSYGAPMAIDADGSCAIAVPSPTAWGAQRFSLTITGVKDGLPAILYRHTFYSWEYDIMAAVGDSASVKLENYSGKTFDGFVILAVYNSSGALAHLESQPVAIADGAAANVPFAASLAEYPSDQYSLALFVWDSSYAPVYPAWRN